jgi:hypothetical protein
MFRSTKICYLAKLLMLADCIYSLNSVNTGLLIESRRLTVPPDTDETAENPEISERFLRLLREAPTVPAKVYCPYFEKICRPMRDLLTLERFQILLKQHTTLIEHFFR